MQSTAGASQQIEVQEIRSWAGISTAANASGSGNLADSTTDELRSWQQTSATSHSVVKDSAAVSAGVATGQEELRSWGSFPAANVERSLSDAPGAVKASPQSSHVPTAGQVTRRTHPVSSEKNSPAAAAQPNPTSKASSRKKLPIRISPWRTLPKLGIAASRRGGIVSFIDACLRSFGQVFFQNSPVSGALFIIALLASSTPVMAAGAPPSLTPHLIVLFLCSNSVVFQSRFLPLCLRTRSALYSSMTPAFVPVVSGATTHLLWAAA